MCGGGAAGRHQGLPDGEELQRGEQGDTGQQAQRDRSRPEPVVAQPAPDRRRQPTPLTDHGVRRRPTLFCASCSGAVAAQRVNLPTRTPCPPPPTVEQHEGLPSGGKRLSNGKNLGIKEERTVDSSIPDLVAGWYVRLWATGSEHRVASRGAPPPLPSRCDGRRGVG